MPNVSDMLIFEVLDPASLEPKDRARLTRDLETLGIVRLSVEHSTHRQTLKKIGDEWQVTCSNAKY